MSEPPRFIFRHGTERRVYANFRAASRQTFGLPTLAHKLRIGFASTEEIEAVALAMARGERLTVYLRRDGHISEVGVPYERPEIE